MLYSVFRLVFIEICVSLVRFPLIFLVLLATFIFSLLINFPDLILFSLLLFFFLAHLASQSLASFLIYVLHLHLTPESVDLVIFLTFFFFAFFVFLLPNRIGPARVSFFLLLLVPGVAARELAFADSLFVSPFLLFLLLLSLARCGWLNFGRFSDDFGR